VKHSFSYDEYDACLESGEVDAVYIVLPNPLHCEYTVRAARKCIHMLCEKPMAPTSSECAEMNEMTTSFLEFPGEVSAAFTTSFGAADSGAYDVVGTEGTLRVDLAYEYAGELRHILTVKGKTRERTFRKRDQFAPELSRIPARGR